jgi:hypothetical protein
VGGHRGVVFETATPVKLIHVKTILSYSGSQISFTVIIFYICTSYAY